MLTLKCTCQGFSVLGVLFKVWGLSLLAVLYLQDKNALMAFGGQYQQFRSLKL
jgi:hypothetical protein